MNDEQTSRCPDGWEPAQLLAYIDGEMDEPTATALVDHLSRCAICSGELSGLQAMNALLETFPDAFHPDAQELYLFVARSHDPKGVIAGHLSECRQCREEVDLLRQMIEMGAESGRERPALPASLRARLESIHPLPPVTRTRQDSIFERLVSRLKPSFRPPVLALGTAASLLILSVLLIQVWRGQVDVSRTVAMHPPAEAPFVENGSSGRRPDIIGPSEPRSAQEPVQRLAEKRTQPVTKAPAPPALRRQGTADREMEADTADTGKIATRAKRSLRGVEPLKEQEEQRVEQKDSQRTLGFRGEAKRKTGAYDREQPSVTMPAPAQPAVRATVPVKIRIVSSPEGLDIPTSVFALPTIVNEGYEVVEVEREGTVRERTKEKGDERAIPTVGKEDVPLGGFLVLITVQRSGNEYDIDGKLFGPGAVLKKTVKEDRIGKDELRDGISRMISSLLTFE